MVLCVFMCVLLILIDRIIYVKQSRTDVRIKKYYINKESRFIRYNEPENEADYEEVIFQFESKNKVLASKFVVNVVVLILVHVFLFWYFVMVGNKNLIGSYTCIDKSEAEDEEAKCNNFSQNIYLKAIYLLFLVYFFFSSLQVKFGFYDIKDKSLLMRGDSVINNSLYKTYLAIPFLFELKIMLDWSVLPTSLDIFQWLKFEQIYDLLFVTHCTMKGYNAKPVARRISLGEKMIGWIGVTLLILLIVGPLLLFSSFNPTNKANDVTAAQGGVY